MKILLIELWGLGDAVMMTGVVSSLRAAGHQIGVLCKPSSATLLALSYSECSYFAFSWPWTAFRRKYWLWTWPWMKMFRLIAGLRNEHYDIVFSVRQDPRDHLLMLLCGVKRRVGYGVYGSQSFLTGSLRMNRDIHRVECWRNAVMYSFPDLPVTAPCLGAAASALPDSYADICKTNSSVVVIHCGAGQKVRRWPVRHWADIIRSIRRSYNDVRIVVIPEADGYGSDLEGLADLMLRDLPIGSLVAVLGRADAVMANDSGPGHIAAALGTPVCSIFGPQVPAVFRPYGDIHCVVEGMPCRYRPCFDSCHFDKPYCLLNLEPAVAWLRIHTWLSKQLGVPES